MDRAQLDWLHDKREASLNAKLTDEDRWAMMRDLYEAHLTWERTLTADQLARYHRAEWLRNRWWLDPRYRALMQAAAVEAGEEDPPR
jgi:hypothetical protein